MKKLNKFLVEVISKKFLAVIVSLLFIFNVANPILAADVNVKDVNNLASVDTVLQTNETNNGMAIVNDGEEISLTFSCTNAKIEGITYKDDTNGQRTYYAVVSNNKQTVFAEISKNLGTSILTNKISKEDISITINNAETKYEDGKYIVDSTHVKVEGISKEAPNTDPIENTTAGTTTENSEMFATAAASDSTTKAKKAKKATKAKSTKSTKKQKTKKVTSKNVNKLATQNTNLIKKLLKTKGLNNLAKKWLKEALNLINSTKKSKKSNATKYATLQKTLNSLKAIQKAKCSNVSIVNETLKKGSAFSSLGKKVLNKDNTYKVYKDINASIDKLLKKDISDEQKNYINELKNTVQKKFNEGNTTWLKKAQISINNIVKGNGSIASMEKEFSSNNIFSSIWNSFKNSAMYKIFKDYGGNVFKVFSGLAKVLNFTVDFVKDMFVDQMGVKKDDMIKVAPTLLTLINREVNFVNCASNVVSKFLGISRPLAALMNLAADISINVDRFIENFKNVTSLIPTYTDAISKALQNNGYKNIRYLNVSLHDIMNSKEGTKFVVYINAYTYDKENEKHNVGHFINIIKGKDNKFSVSDNLTNKGEYITYTAEEFEKFMKGETAKGTTTKGESITVDNKYNTTEGLIKYKRLNDNNEARVITNLTDLQAKIYEKYGNYGVVIENLAEKLNINPETIFNQFVSLGINEDDMFIIDLYFDDYKNETNCVSLMYEESKKYGYTQQVATALKSLIDLSSNESLTIYKKYGEYAVIIEFLTEKLNISQKTIDNKFIEKGLNRADVYLIKYYLNLFENEEKSLALLHNAIVNGPEYKNDDSIVSNNNLIATVLQELINISGAEVATLTNLEETIYKKYDAIGFVAISNLSKKLNMSQETIFNQFVSLDINKADIYTIFDSFEECKNEENCINSMCDYCDYTQIVEEFRSDSQRIATALKSLMELSNLEIAA